MYENETNLCLYWLEILIRFTIINGASGAMNRH